MTLQERRDAVQARAEQLRSAIVQRRNEIEQLQADVYRCDGQFRMLGEMIDAEKPPVPPSETPPDGAPPTPDAPAPDAPTPDTTTDAGAPAKEIPS